MAASAMIRSLALLVATAAAAATLALRVPAVFPGTAAPITDRSGLLDALASAIQAASRSTKALIEPAIADAPMLVVATAAGASVPVLALLISATRLLVATQERRRQAAEMAATGRPEVEASLLPSTTSWIDSRDGDGQGPHPRQITGEILRIGAAPECDVRLDPSAGSGEAIIHRSVDGSCRIIDPCQGRAAPLLVNGRPVIVAELLPGDSVCLGAARFTFHRGSTERGSDDRMALPPAR